MEKKNLRLLSKSIGYITESFGYMVCPRKMTPFGLKAASSFNILNKD